MQKITEKLIQLEKDFGIEILFAVESGSRAWGFESPDSDWDIRFIYKRPLTWYLSVHERRDVVEQMFKAENFDFSGWDLKKVLYQIHRGNPALFEWFDSPIVYRSNEQFQLEMNKLQAKYFNPRSAIYHYLHMAIGNYRTYLKTDMVKLKKYFYVIRPLLACEWIERRNTMPPTKFSTLIGDEIECSRDFPHDSVQKLRDLKQRSSELGEGTRIEVINEWIANRIEHFAEIARTTAKVTSRPDDLDEYFYSMCGKN